MHSGVDETASGKCTTSTIGAQTLVVHRRTLSTVQIRANKSMAFSLGFVVLCLTIPVAALALGALVGLANVRRLALRPVLAAWGPYALLVVATGLLVTWISPTPRTAPDGNLLLNGARLSHWDLHPSNVGFYAMSEVSAPNGSTADCTRLGPHGTTYVSESTLLPLDAGDAFSSVYVMRSPGSAGGEVLVRLSALVNDGGNEPANVLKDQQEVELPMSWTQIRLHVRSTSTLRRASLSIANPTGAHVAVCGWAATIARTRPGASYPLSYFAKTVDANGADRARTTIAILLSVLFVPLCVIGLTILSGVDRQFDRRQHPQLPRRMHCWAWRSTWPSARHGFKGPHSHQPSMRQNF